MNILVIQFVLVCRVANNMSAVSIATALWEALIESYILFHQIVMYSATHSDAR